MGNAATGWPRGLPPSTTFHLNFEEKDGELVSNEITEPLMDSFTIRAMRPPTSPHTGRSSSWDKIRLQKLLN